jgi:hypothetical protein
MFKELFSELQRKEEHPNSPQSSSSKIKQAANSPQPANN